MAGSFDPYSEWLGLEGGRPQNVYALLGLQPFESDPQRIAQAADRASAKLREIQPGQRQAEWNHLLDQIRATKACLLDAQRKKAYDQKLAARQSAAVALGSSSLPTVLQPAVPYSAAARKKSASGPLKQPVLIGLAALVVGLGVLGIVFKLVVSGDKPVPIAKSESSRSSTSPELRPPAPPAPPPPPAGQATKPPAPPATTESPQNLRGFAPLPKPKAEQPKPETPKAVQEDPPPDRPAKPMTEFDKSADEVRLAMADRNLPAAAERLKTAKTLAKTEAELSQIERLTTMLDNLEQFWGGIQASMEKLQAAEEIVIRDSRVVVVDSGRDFLNVKVAGRVHRFQLKTLPTSLVMALVHQYFGTDTGTKAIVGTFLVVEPGGDRALARQYWLEAARDGIDTEKLLPEIDAMSLHAARNGKKKP